jgi:hypothetical protein
MFNNEKIYIVDNKEQTLKLVDSSGKLAALIFINLDRIIIRGELLVGESNIKAPEIKKI